MMTFPRHIAMLSAWIYAGFIFPMSHFYLWEGRPLQLLMVNHVNDLLCTFISLVVLIHGISSISV